MVFCARSAALAVGLFLGGGVVGCGGSDLVAQEATDTSSSVAPGSTSPTPVPTPTGSTSPGVAETSTPPVASTVGSAEPPRGCAQITEEAIYIDVTTRESPSARDQRRGTLEPMKKLLIAHCIHKQDPEVLSACVVKAGAEAANADRLAALRACYGGQFPPKM